MSFQQPGRGALDYFPCRYGKSKILFRGPKRELNGAYVAAIGGTETYGRFIEKPFATLVEDMLGYPVVNFGCVNAGIDVFRNEPSILQACTSAKVTVLQIMGAQNMSNRFYSVHPRRNDRFIRASTLLKTIFREVDFTDFNFNRHMLTALQTLSPERFEVVKDELREAWTARMRTLIAAISSPVVLFWFADRQPEEADNGASLGGDPLFVNRDMIEALRSQVAGIIEVIPSQAAMMQGTEGMIFSAMEVPAAHAMLSVSAHHEAADALARGLGPFFGN